MAENNTEITVTLTHDQWMTVIVAMANGAEVFPKAEDKQLIRSTRQCVSEQVAESWLK